MRKTPDKPPVDTPTVAFYTLGCKTNQLETSTLADAFAGEGWRVVGFDDPAALYVINTCTVTERADQESKRIIRRARLSNPEGRIAVTGCYAQVAPDEIAAEDGVNYVIGNNFKDDLVRIVDSLPPLKLQKSSRPLVRVSDIDKSRIMEGGSRADIGRTRGSLKIQDGCDYKCTYCIIWEARGASRSLPVADVKAALGRMVFEGFKEIVLTGINIGQYEDKDADLADLLAELCTVPGKFRLRLTSLDPLEVTTRLVDTVAASEGKICPHFHLSAQSAEDAVLKRMARRHHTQDMLDVCDYIGRTIPGCSVASDIIVGFPGETPERFETTCENLENCYMNYFHVFSYSKRRGTPAADFSDQVPAREKKQRAKRLRALSDEKDLAYRRRFIGKVLDVIVEDSGERGMSENYIKVDIANAAELGLKQNDRVPVRITAVDGERTAGEAVL